MFKVFRHYVPISMALLAIGEAILFFLLLQTLYAVQPTFLALSDGPSEPDFAAGLSFTAIAVLSYMALGLYNRDVLFDIRSFYTRAGLAAVLAFVAMFLAMQLYGLANVTYPQWYLVVADSAVILHLIIVSLIRYGLSAIAGIDLFKRRILIIGEGEPVAKMRRFLAGDAGRRLVLAGFVDRAASFNADPLTNSETPASFPEARSALEAKVRELNVDEIVVASRDRRGLPVWDLLACRVAGVTIVDYISFWERETGRIDLDEVRPSWMAFSDGFARDASRRLIKRSFDVLVSASFLLAMLPIMALVALLIRLDSPGPIFYLQERVGEGGRKFRILKFRSMRTDAEAAGAPKWASTDDPRITRIGKFIRKARIDEVPQVINVLKGEMSFIGPRPERPSFVEELAGEIPLYKLRHEVRPGITGWAQINFPYGASVDDARQKLSYDLYYVKNGSLFLDVVILLQTVRVVLMLIGSR